MARLRETFTTAAFVTVGFIGHKALTHGLCNKLLLPMLEKNGAVPAATSGFGQTNGNSTALKQALPILCGGVVAVAGIWGAAKFAPKSRATAIGAGMLTSWLHTTLVAVFDMTVKSATTKANVMPWIAGYDTSSTAASIGRYRRNRGVRGMRGMRGLGQPVPDRNISSILPSYAPTGRPGGIQQAVAMAGRGTGEYFQTSGVGEYFATGVQGIGQYEPAGPLVTQAAAGLGQQIDNGIMPDQADAALTLAEAQAGTGASMMGGRGTRGMGEYYSAKPENGEWRDYRVPTQSQWIPSGPLWAGTKPAQDALQTSEIPAGVLESASGNGIF